MKLLSLILIANLILLPLAAVAVVTVSYLVDYINIPTATTDAPVFSPPITIHIEQDIDRSDSINLALEEVSRYVPLVVTGDEDADICLMILDTSSIDAALSLGRDHVGKTTFSSRPTHLTPDCRGRVLIQVAGQNDYIPNIIVHELLHGLGVKGHSRDHSDIMFRLAGPNYHLSPNDIASLRQLYP